MLYMGRQGMGATRKIENEEEILNGIRELLKVSSNASLEVAS